MDIKSLIDTILQSIATGTSSDVKINDRTFFSELMDDSEIEGTVVDTDIRPRCPVWRNDRRFPLFSFIYSLVESVLSVFLWAFYGGFSLLYSFFSGRKRNLQHSRRFNAAVFLSSLLVAAAVLIYSMVFFIKDVILFPMDMRTNHNGAIIAEQPCSVEQYMLLFNSSSMWADSGIEVCAGDKIEISYSGSFYGDIKDMKDMAKANDRLKYERTVGASLPRQEETKQKQDQEQNQDQEQDQEQEQEQNQDQKIYENAPFGTLLYQIRTDNAENGTEKPVTFTGKSIYCDRADASGILFFAVNDLCDEKKETQKHYFYDNCGELLINVRVYRNGGLNVFENMFRRIDTGRGTLLLILSGLLALALIDRGLGLILSRCRGKRRSGQVT